MAVFRYNVSVNVKKDNIVEFTIKHPSNGTASHTIIDLPGEKDLEATNEQTLELGEGKKLLEQRTVVYSKVVNMDENNTNVEIQFLIDDQIIVDHSNPKSIDPSPQLKININFIESWND